MVTAIRSGYTQDRNQTLPCKVFARSSRDEQVSSQVDLRQANGSRIDNAYADNPMQKPQVTWHRKTSNYIPGKQRGQNKSAEPPLQSNSEGHLVHEHREQGGRDKGEPSPPAMAQPARDRSDPTSRTKGDSRSQRQD